MSSDPTVYVVDDDQKARRSVCALVSSMGLRAREFASAEEFLADFRSPSPGCLVTDVRMLGMSGLDLLDELKRRDIRLPVIILTAYARTPLIVKAMKAGAVTVLDKPYPQDELWEAVVRALMQDSATCAEAARRDELRSRIAALTPSERAVVDMVVQGKPNKTIAKQLGVSVRTVENRRREVLTKLRANSVAELVQVVIEAGMYGESSRP